MLIIYNLDYKLVHKRKKKSKFSNKKSVITKGVSKMSVGRGCKFCISNVSENGSQTI